MASKVLICDTCSRLNKSTDGLKFCTDCDDALCLDCSTTHSALKFTILHNVVDASVLTGRAFNLKNFCNDHEELPLEFFCSDHDSLLCRSCMTNTHLNCGKILPLDVAAKGIKSSIMIEDICKDIGALQKSIKELAEDREKNKKHEGRTKDLTLQNITQFRKDVNKHLDKLKKKLSSDVYIKAKELDEKASIRLSEAVTREKKIEGIWERVNFLSKHGSESQLLTLVIEVRPEITKQLINFQEMIISLEMNGLDFEQVDLVSSISSMGLGEPTCSPCSVSYQHHKHMQSQIQQTQVKVPIWFELEKKVTITLGKISCIAVIDYNRLLLCNDMVCPFKKNIIAYTEEGEQVQACTIFKRVYGIAIIPHTKEAVISLADVKIIHFVNIVSLVPGRQIKVVIEDNSIYGIAVVRESIIVGGSCGNVHFIDKMKGICLKTIKIGPGAIRSIVPFISAKDDVVDCCEHSGNKKVHRLKLDGSLISNCELENLKGMTKKKMFTSNLTTLVN